MTQLAEVELQSELDTLRTRVSGLTFSEAPETFKDIESAKVRLTVLRDPEHYKKLLAESEARRASYPRRARQA